MTEELKGDIVVIPKAKRLIFPPGVLKAMRRKKGKNKELLSKWVWRDRRKKELEEKDLERLNRVLEKFLVKAKKQTDPIAKRIKVVLDSGNKNSVINLILDIEEKSIEKFDEDIPVEMEEIYEYTKVPIADEETAKILGLLGEPTVKEELTKTEMETFIIPGVEFEDVDDIIYYKPVFRTDPQTGVGLLGLPYDEPLKMRVIGDIQIGGPVTKRPVLPLSLKDVYITELKEMDIEKLAEIAFENDIIFEDKYVDIIQLFLDKNDIKSPSIQIETLKEQLEMVDAEIAENGEDKEQKKLESEVLNEQIKYLEDNLKEANKDHKIEIEEIDEKISKTLKKNKITLKKLKAYILKEIISKKSFEEKKSSPVKEIKRKYTNKYNSKYPKFTRVQFISPEEEELEGVVMDFTEKGIHVSVSQERAKPAKIYKISYSNPTLKIVEKKKADVEKQKFLEFKQEIAPEELKKEFVTRAMRDMIIKMYVKILSKEKEKSKDVPDVQEQNYLKNLKKVFKPMTWEEFFTSRYDRWLFFLFEKEVKIDEKKLMEKTKTIIAKQRDEDILIKQITDLLQYDENTTANDFYDILNKKHPLTRVQTYFLKEISRLENKDIKGSDLALLIEKSIHEYLQNTSFDEKVIYEKLRMGYILRSYKKSREEENYSEYEKIFKKLFEEDIKLEYEKYQKEYPRQESEKEKVQEKEDPDIQDRVEKFENNCYDMSSGTMESYLKRVLMPYLFLQGPLASSATFFRAKIENKSFDFGSLAVANLAHYLPEFSAPNIAEPTLVEGDTSGSLETAINIISELLNIEIITILDLYISILNPTKRKENRRLIENISSIIDPLKNILRKLPEFCMSQSGTGTRQVIKDGKYLFEKHEDGTVVPVMEQIPEGDMVLCYDSKDNKFRCFDSNEVLRDISRSKSKRTKNKEGYIYPVDFIEKIKQRSRLVVDQPGELFEEKKYLPPKKFEESQMVPKRKRTIPLHTPSKKREKEGFYDIEKILLLGEQFDMITLFFHTLDFQGPDGLREIPITTNVKSKNSNVVVIGLDVSGNYEKRLQSLKRKIKSDGSIYIIVTGSISKKDSITMNKNIKSILDVQEIFYTFSYHEEDIRDALINVVIDVEGPEAVKDETKIDEWAYRAKTPRLEKKIRAEKKIEEKLKAKKIKEDRKAEKKLSEKKSKKYDEEEIEDEEIEIEDEEIEIEDEEIEIVLEAPKKLTKAEKIALKKRKEDRESDPLLRAALIGDVKEVEKLMKEEDGYKVVEVYKYIQQANGDSQVLKILRNDPRVLEIALDGDEIALKYLLDHSTEPKFRPEFVYRMAENKNASEKIKKILRNYQSVKDLLREEYEKRMAREKRKK